MPVKLPSISSIVGLPNTPDPVPVNLLLAVTFRLNVSSRSDADLSIPSNTLLVGNLILLSSCPSSPIEFRLVGPTTVNFFVTPAKSPAKASAPAPNITAGLNMSDKFSIGFVKLTALVIP